MTNTSETEILDIEFVDSKEKLISLVREYINGIDTENIDGFDSSSKKFKQSIHFESIEKYIKDKLNPKSLEYLENAHGTSRYLGALFFELDIIFKDSLISFEYMSIGPCSFFQSIGTLDLNDKYIYYYRNFDDYGSKIFLKQDRKVYDELVKPTVFQYFKDMSKFNLDVSMESLPSNITINDSRLDDEEFLKDCFKVFLDNPKEYSEEKWFYEEEDLNSRFEFEDNHYKRSINTLKKVPEMIKEYEENKGKDRTYDKNCDNDKERILKLIYYHKVNAYI